MSKMIKIAIITFLFIYLIIVFVLFLFQEKIIFQNTTLPQNHVFYLNQNFEEVNLKTTDNHVINALHIKAENPKGVVLYFHGNKGDLERWKDIVSYFTTYNLDVFIMDYRSYGKSTGKFNEALMYKDAELCYKYIKTKFAEDKITIYGRSLGCTFAIKTASINNPKQIILESPFYNLSFVARNHYPLIPYKLVLKYPFNSNKYIQSVSCKTTIFHGTEDQIIPIKSAEKLYKVSNKKNTDLIIIPKGTHHNIMRFELYKNTISTLLQE
jgi:fermentation-respiration switch protein FrsA (DUF1100 family)